MTADTGGMHGVGDIPVVTLPPAPADGSSL